MRMKGAPMVTIARGHVASSPGLPFPSPRRPGDEASGHGNDRCCILPTHIIHVQLPALVLCLHTCRQDLVFDAGPGSTCIWMLNQAASTDFTDLKIYL